MNWLEPVDQYCERLDATFWAEPLNALSNTAFIIAGLVLLRAWLKAPEQNIPGLLLVLNVLVIGAGSFLFHTFANRWSALADVLPITVFIHAYLFLALRTYVGFRWWQAGLAVLAFFALAPLLAAVLAPLAGSSAVYVPALLAIFAVAAASRQINRPVSGALRDVGLIFAVSIAFRAADLPLCEALPQGTHARWHLLNSFVLFLLVRLYLKTAGAPPLTSR